MTDHLLRKAAQYEALAPGDPIHNVRKLPGTTRSIQVLLCCSYDTSRLWGRASRPPRAVPMAPVGGSRKRPRGRWVSEEPLRAEIVSNRERSYRVLNLHQRFAECSPLARRPQLSATTSPNFLALRPAALPPSALAAAAAPPPAWAGTAAGPATPGSAACPPTPRFRRRLAAGNACSPVTEATKAANEMRRNYWVSAQARRPPYA